MAIDLILLAQPFTASASLVFRLEPFQKIVTAEAVAAFGKSTIVPPSLTGVRRGFECFVSLDEVDIVRKTAAADYNKVTFFSDS